MAWLLPDDVRERLISRYRNGHGLWFDGGGSWPVLVTLGRPTQHAMSTDPSGIRAWVEAWAGWRGPATLRWTTRHWTRLGSQHVPHTLTLEQPEQVAAWIGESARWNRAVQRRDALIARWPQLLGQTGRHFDVLADYDDQDYERLLRVAEWLLAHPASDCYLRQLPISGVHTKWIESRTRAIGALVASLRGIRATDFYSACGVRRQPSHLRFRVLCPQLRERLSGLHDIAVSVGQLAGADLKPHAVLVVENQQCGIALPDLPGVVAFIGMGNAIAAVEEITWLAGLPAVYWGDIDTYGLAILARARAVFPQLRSVLMDEAALLAHRDLWGEEKRQHGAVDAATLTPAELALFGDLKNHRWGINVRLEQEQLPWTAAIEAVTRAVDAVREPRDR